MHLVGLKLKKITNLKWIADFRDPWSNFIQNKFLNSLNQLKLNMRKKKVWFLNFQMQY